MLRDKTYRKVSGCTLWSYVHCGVMYTVELCTLWSYVHCGVMYTVELCISNREISYVR